MNEFEDELASAGDALLALAEGPGVAAAEALEAAFGQAGARIERSLSQAARTGELDFERMAEAILRDLARVAAEGCGCDVWSGRWLCGADSEYEHEFCGGGGCVFRVAIARRCKCGAGECGGGWGAFLVIGFDDVRFPMRLARGASGGPERRVEVVTLASGAEQRGSVWAGSRRRWDVGSAVANWRIWRS